MSAAPSPERMRLLAGFRLGEWVVKPEDGSLSSVSSTARLEPMLMDLLVFLCSRVGQVVPKQDVLNTVWGGRFVSDETVKSSFYQLRKALGDNPRQPRFIETLPKRGYRILVEPVPLEEHIASANTEAEELYRKGRLALSARTSPDALKQARLYFERATQSDPENAEALSGLAVAYVQIAISGAAKGSEILPRAKAAAQRAAELDPRIPEAHVTLGIVRAAHDHDLTGAINEFQLALELDPRNSTAHRWYAKLLSSLGRQSEGIAEARRGVEADPLSLAARFDLLEILFMARRYDEAIAESHALFDMAPGSAEVQLGMVWVYVCSNRDREALESFKRGLQSLGVAEPLLQRAQEMFDRGGMRDVLRLWAAFLEQQAMLGQKNHIDLLILRALLGENEGCFKLLELLHGESHPYLLWLPVSPVFDHLRSDPRYMTLIARLGFTQPFPNQ